jgi:hypothetical protein
MKRNINKFNHKKDCDCPIVNPITEWTGGSNLIIVGYKCPKCLEETFIENRESPVQNPYSYTSSEGEHIT